MAGCFSECFVFYSDEFIFAGIANIRGNLYAVTDFSLFRGGEPTLLNANARLLLVGVKLGSNAALLVTRMQGLKAVADYEPVEKSADAPDADLATLLLKRRMRYAMAKQELLDLVS